MAIPYRLLALEIRVSKLGFAVLEEPTTLLDWGVRSFGEQPRELPSTASDRVDTLLEFHRPRVVVVRARKYHSRLRQNKFHAIMDATQTAVGRHSAVFTAVAPQKVRDYFSSLECLNKHDVATHLVKNFDELSWKLPRRRKSYQSEPPAMLVFDALATGVAYLAGQSPSYPEG
jgi:hypothetical protein